MRGLIIALGCLTVVAPASAKTDNGIGVRRRVLATKTWSSTVATAGGRAAFISTDADYGPHRLLLVDLSGKVLKRLERYGERRWPEGEIALTDRWVAWSVKRTSYDHPTGPGNVFLKPL